MSSKLFGESASCQQHDSGAPSTHIRVGCLDSLARTAVHRALTSMPEAVDIQEYGERSVQDNPAYSPHATVLIHVNDPRFYRLVSLRGALGAADAYRKGYWDSDDLTELFRIFARRIGRESNAERRLSWLTSIPSYLRHVLRGNGRRGARRNIKEHYDLGNEFFELFLDPTLTYSCGIFEGQQTDLQAASETKLRRICDMLRLRPGQSVLEIGSGWGSFAILAAREYGCKITTVTLSQNQQAEADRRVRLAGVENLVEVRLQDYRDVGGTYDRIVSIEMIEAIGHSRLGEFFAHCSRLLAPDGAMALQVITMPDQGYSAYLRRTDVIREYVFPGSNCPSRSAVLRAATLRSDLRMTRLEEIGHHYAVTLRHWREAYLERLDQARGMGYSEEFLRMWHFYLSYCEAGFAERHVGNVQMVFSKPRFEERGWSY